MSKYRVDLDSRDGKTSKCAHERKSLAEVFEEDEESVWSVLLTEYFPVGSSKLVMFSLVECCSELSFTVTTIALRLGETIVTIGLACRVLLSLWAVNEGDFLDIFIWLILELELAIRSLLGDKLRAVMVTEENLKCGVRLCKQSRASGTLRVRLRSKLRLGVIVLDLQGSSYNA